ncbi:hypothetical protein LZ017_11405 [Pelomonas sp. CA6]|uniref:hypothetical protein n=1 Tax=Pelomonas sp. CA6 TaxID=2907999 RepID=UPI001F4C4612|nr:hypothetical protein [Pelomonas sp. CA6]MCH7343986.1 hypothetical protein [Pelomonas sp. CA6]
MLRISVCLSLAVLLAACAATDSSSTKVKVVQAEGTDVRCTQEVRTGTLLASVQCRSAEQRAEERRSVDEAAEAIRRTMPRREKGGQ